MPRTVLLLVAMLMLAGPALAGAAAADAAADPDPRFLRLDRRPAAGEAVRVRLRSLVTLALTVEPAAGGDASPPLTLELTRRLDAVVRTLQEDAGSDRFVLEVQVIDGEARAPDTGPVRLPIGRRFRVRSGGAGPSIIEPADDGPPLEEPERDALLVLLDMAGAADAGLPRATGPVPDESSVLGLADPRSIGETWRPDPAAVARLADLTVNDVPPTAPEAEATATRRSPVIRDGRTIDRVDVRFTLSTSNDETTASLRGFGARGAIEEGATSFEASLEFPREPGAVVVRETVRTRSTAVAAGLADSPPARLEVAGEMTLDRTAVSPAQAAAAVERARVARDEGRAAITRANRRAAPWGLQFDAFAGDPEWTAVEPDPGPYLFEAEAADGARLWVIRPDVVRRHGGSMAGLDEAVRLAGSSGAGFTVGEPFDVTEMDPPVRARYGVTPSGVGRWFIWTLRDGRPVLLIRSDVPNAAPPSAATMRRLIDMVVTTTAGRAEAMAAHPGVLSIGGDRAGATPPSWLGATGADIAARGEGWRLVAWTVPFGMPADVTPVMLDAAAELTGFAGRRDAPDLTLEPVRRMGRDGTAAVTATARLEVLAGDEDIIVILATHEGPPARPAMLAALGRLVLGGPIAAALPATDDGPIGQAARARAAAEFVAAFGVRLLQMNINQTALDAFERSLSIDPEATSVRLNRVRALHAVGRGAEAGQLIDADPGLAGLLPARRLRARVSLDAGNVADARRRYEAVLAEVPDPESAANLVFAVRELDGAEPALEGADAWMQAHGDHPMVLLAMSIVAADAGDPAEALGLIERAIALTPDDQSLLMFRRRYRRSLEGG